VTGQQIAGRILAALIIVVMRPVVWAFDRWDRSLY
jgi:hypothetical protein